MRWAFSDESRRRKTYVMAAVVVPTYAVNDARAVVKRFRRRNQRRVHMAKESPARRAQFLELIGGLEVEFVAVSTSLSGRTDPEARTATLTALANELIGLQVSNWTLDFIDPVERKRDRRDITPALRSVRSPREMRFDHQRSAGEAMLWVADAVAWDATHDRRLERLRVIELP